MRYNLRSGRNVDPYWTNFESREPELCPEPSCHAFLSNSQERIEVHHTAICQPGPLAVGGMLLDLNAISLSLSLE